MIASLRGVLSELQADHVVVDVKGVGYRVFVSDTTRRTLPPLGQEVFLRISTYLREDALLLFGFAATAEKQTFLLLNGVTGIGPRLALACLSFFSPSEFARAVVTEDIKTLTRVPGIGKKTAQRLVLELRDKLAVDIAEVRSTSEETLPAPGPVSDAVEALMGLGYSRGEVVPAIQNALGALGEEAHGADSATLIRAALRQMVSRR